MNSRSLLCSKKRFAKASSVGVRFIRNSESALLTLMLRSLGAFSAPALPAEPFASVADGAGLFEGFACVEGGLACDA